MCRIRRLLARDPVEAFSGLLRRVFAPLDAWPARHPAETALWSQQDTDHSASKR